MTLNKCNCCGRFKKWSELFGMSAEEPDVIWHECKSCMSDSDFERFCPGEQRPEPPLSVKKIKEILAKSAKAADEMNKDMDGCFRLSPESANLILK